MKKFNSFYKKYQPIIVIISIVLLLLFLILPIATTKSVDRETTYKSMEDVALYVMEYHELPSNYITKSGYDYAKRHGINCDNMIMGGDTFWYEGELDNYGIESPVSLKECDIKDDEYSLENRGTYRLVFTTNADKVRVFVTYDHYGTFEEITMFKLQLMSNIWWIIFGLFLVVEITFYTLVIVSKARENSVPKKKVKKIKQKKVKKNKANI